MPDTLLQQPFSHKFLDEVAEFFCGSDPWDLAQSTWIRDTALSSMETRGTKVWLYYNTLDQLVGFGSLGITRRRFPPPGGEYVQLSIIPSLAIKVEFQGRPEEPPRYSHQIMQDLLAKARLQNTEQLMLDVHRKNSKAIAFYMNFDFVQIGDVHNEHIKMFHRLA